MDYCYEDFGTNQHADSYRQAEYSLSPWPGARPSPLTSRFFFG